MYPGAFPGTGGTELGKPHVRIRGGTSEDPTQMVPPSGYNLHQMPPPSAYGSSQVPPGYSSMYSQQMPTSAYSSNTSAFPSSTGASVGIPLGMYGAHPQPTTGLGGAPPMGNHGRPGFMANHQHPSGGQGSPVNAQYRGSASIGGNKPSILHTNSQSARFDSRGSPLYGAPGHTVSPNQGGYPGSVGNSPHGGHAGGPHQGMMSLRYEPVGAHHQHRHVSPLSPDDDGPSPSKDFAIPDSISTQSKVGSTANRSNSGKLVQPGPTPQTAVDAAANSLSRLSVASGESGSGVSGEGKEEFPATPSGLLSPEGEMAACRRFTFEQLKVATDNFSQSNFLGKGALDAVYKGRLMGCKVAVKRLEGTGFQGPIEYRTEVEVLSRMRHPNIVLLMGHCPEEHCLVYEYLSGGNIQKCLEKSKGTKNLRWHERIKVLNQVVDALLYLHHHDPPIVHRDLNPANVLIDSNCTVKLADVGLARLIRDDDAVTAGPKGTPGYIDPEEMMTCEVSTLGDVYAFGLIGLQLLLGERSIMKLQKILNEAKAGGGRGFSKAADELMGKIDGAAGDWPGDITRQLAVLFLRCTESQRMRRPDLAEEIQPVLHRAAEKAAAEAEREAQGLHSQLMCPLSKVRMTDPVLAADGYTYERSSIEVWLQKSGNSPVTGAPLEHTFLMPNNGLRQILLSS